MILKALGDLLGHSTIHRFIGGQQTDGPQTEGHLAWALQISKLSNGNKNRNTDEIERVLTIFQCKVVTHIRIVNLVHDRVEPYDIPNIMAIPRWWVSFDDGTALPHSDCQAEPSYHISKFHDIADVLGQPEQSHPCDAEKRIGSQNLPLGGSNGGGLSQAKLSVQLTDLSILMAGLVSRQLWCLLRGVRCVL